MYKLSIADVMSEASEAVTVVAARPRKVVRARGRAALNKVPDDVINDPELRLAMEVFPDNYNLEIPKTIWRIRRDNFKMVALQLPEGLTMFATSLSDIIEKFTTAQTVIMSDDEYERMSNTSQTSMKGDEAFAKRKAGLQKNELNEQLKDYINQWRDERSKEVNNVWEGGNISL